MRFINFYRLITLGFPLILSVLQQAYAQNEADDSEQVQPEATIIVSAEGSVGVTNIRTGKALPASRIVAGTSLPDGHSIKTGEGGKVVCLLSNGTIFNVSPQSEMVISQFTQEPFEATDDKISDLETEPSVSEVKLKLNYGNLVTDVKKLNQGSSFNIESPLGSAGIRGTTVNTVAIPDGNGGFTGSFGVTGGSKVYSQRCSGAAATEIAENQVNGEVSETGQVQVEAPSVMSPADQQQLNATAEQAEASDDTSVAEASNAAAETTQQVQSEVDNGAPAEPADPPASDPAEEPEPAPEPEPTPGQNPHHLLRTPLILNQQLNQQLRLIIQ